MNIEALAAKLNCQLVLSYIPEIEDSQNQCHFISNPMPWRCRKYDHSNDEGKGTTPDEACAGLVVSMLKRAQETLKRETDSQKRATEYLESLINLNRELGR